MFVFGANNNYDRATMPDQPTYSLVVKGPHQFNGPKYNGLNSPLASSPAPKVFKLAPAPCGRFPTTGTSASVKATNESEPTHFVFPTLPLTPGPSPNVIDLDAAMSNLFDQHTKQHCTSLAVHYDRFFCTQSIARIRQVSSNNFLLIDICDWFAMHRLFLSKKFILKSLNVKSSTGMGEVFLFFVLLNEPIGPRLAISKWQSPSVPFARPKGKLKTGLKMYFLTICGDWFMDRSSILLKKKFSIFHSPLAHTEHCQDSPGFE